MAKGNITYWLDRARLREQQTFRRGAGLSLSMFEQYQDAGRSIKRDIEAMYGKYAGKHGLTYEQAVKRLNRAELQEFKASLSEYLEAIRTADPAIRPMMQAHLDALAANAEITRLQALEGQIQHTLNQLYDTGVRQMREQFGDMYTQAYYHKHFDIQQRAGFMREVAKINTTLVQKAVEYPWAGANFSQAYWQNIAALSYNVRITLTQGFIRGDSVSVMSKTLADNMGKSFNRAATLIRTESNYLHNDAEKETYKAAGIEKYEFMATLDERTTTDCGNLDGEVFDVDKAQPGVNYPPMHHNCRSTTIEHDPEDALDWAASGVKMPKNMTYKEWVVINVKEDP